MGTAHGADAAQAAAALFELQALRATGRVQERTLLDATTVVLLFHDLGYCAVVQELNQPTYLDVLLDRWGVYAYNTTSDMPPWALAYEHGDRLIVLGKGGLNDSLRRLYRAILTSGEERIEYGRALPR